MGFYEFGADWLKIKIKGTIGARKGKYYIQSDYIIALNI